MRKIGRAIPLYLLAIGIAVQACGGAEPSLREDGGFPAPDAGAAALPDAGPSTGADAGQAPSTDAGATPPDGGAVQPPPPRARYLDGPLISPITAGVVASMKAIRARASGPRDDVFMKVGASGTVIRNFLYCFAGGGSYELDLDGRTELQPTIDYFKAADADGTTPFDRETLSAKSGRSAVWAISGDPSPLEAEIDKINPRVALVNYGTNDMQLGTTYRSAMRNFHRNFTSLLGQLVDQGIVPIITGLNPRTDYENAGRWVPTYNAVVRGVAEYLQVPYINLYWASVILPNQGLLSDGLHGNVYSTASGAQPCDFTADGLQYNYNVRNLLTISALDRYRRTVVAREAPPDSPPAAVAGDGSAERPFVIDRLPFTHTADTSESPHRKSDGYPSCDSGQDESGPEYYYKLELSEPTPVRLLVLDQSGVDIDLHLLGSQANAESCSARHDWILERTLPAGTHHLALDTYVSGGTEFRGRYLLVAVRCEPGDPDC